MQQRNRNNNRNNSSEDITKNLVKGISETNSGRTPRRGNDDVSFTEKISYEYGNDDRGDTRSTIDSDLRHLDEYEAYSNHTIGDDGRRLRNRDNQQKDNDISATNYRRNIDKYGKKFFEEDDSSDDYEDEPVNKSSSFSRILIIATIVVFATSTVILSINLTSIKSTNAKLEAELSVSNSGQSAEDKLSIESLQAQNNELQSELNELKGVDDEDGADNSETSNNSSENNTTSNSSNNTSSNNNSSNNSTTTEYTVVQGDVLWTISEKVYGNGAYYTKIVEANNLDENAILAPGKKLKIPQL